jgi:hypothetical protein
MSPEGEAAEPKGRTWAASTPRYAMQAGGVEAEGLPSPENRGARKEEEEAGPNPKTTAVRAERPAGRG